MRFLPQPRWSVTWPTLPSGTYTVLERAVDASNAVKAAATPNRPIAAGYAIAYDYEPSVWRLRRPYRWRSAHAQGPESFPDAVPGQVAFTPVPVDPAWPKSVFARYETVVRAHVELTGGGDRTYHRCTGCDFGRGTSAQAEWYVREQAQAHAEKCRGLRKPEVS